MILFPWVSDTNSIFYKYSVTDVDGALPSEYKVYYQVGENSFEAISTICENSSSIKAYQSAYQCMRLTGLNAGDNYQIYLNPILVEKAGTPETRVDINNFTFEGIHDLANVRYDLELGEDGKSKYNNMISLKISEPYDYLSEDEKLLNTPIKNRIAYYTLEFTVANTDKKFVINNITDSTRQTAPISSNIIEYTSGGKKITWNNQNDRDNLSRVAYVAVCDDGVSTCLYVDYSKLYNSQTFKNVFSELRNQNILVSLNAVYDTGIISYLGNAQNKYVFQVMANNLIEFAGRTYNDNYLLVHGRNIGGVSFSPAALSAVYAYVNSQGGFVDDGADDVVIGSGKIYFINTIYSNLSIVAPNYNYFDAKYQVTSQGIEITFGYGADQITVPLVAKELNTASLNGIGSFAYEQVIPAINVTSKNEIINGIKLDLSLSGITDNDITEESGKRFVYLEIYDSATNEVVKSLKINKNGLTSQVGSVQNNQYQITFDDNYKVDVTQVRTSSGVITDYAYDYKTGLITFNGLEDGTNITVYYRLVLDELNVGSTYYLKAYMLVNNKKSYLVDMLSNTYETFSYEFTTKNASDVKISSASLDVVSKTDYATRHLLTTYNIDEIVGIDNLEYEICNSDKSICVPVNKYQVCENSYNHYDGTCFTKTNGYDSTITHDISISDDLDFVYNTNYNVVIKAKVKEANGNTNSYEIFNQPLNLRALKRPSVNVIQNTGFKDGKNAYLSFDISFTDNDRVVSKPEVNKEKGQYIVYLAMGDNKTKIEGTEKLINIVENGADKMTTITYENLDKNTAYYLTVIYSSYANNVGEVAEDPQSTDYLVYTLDDNGVSVGRYEYTAQGTTTTLKFGYATNMVRDYIAVEGSAPIPDPNQEAFVSGIVYTITRTSGDNLFAINGTKIFDDEVKIVLKNDGDALGAIGETYYQLDIPNTVYPVSAGYDILFQFYLGGQISAHLNSESLCKDDSPSNYWSSVNNECYILDSTKYHENTQYGNGGTKWEN